MEIYKKKSKIQTRIKTTSLVYVFVVCVISILLYYFSSIKDIVTLLSIAAFFAAMLFVYLITFQFKKINADMEAHHELIQREAKTLIKRDWNLTQALEKLKKEKDKAVILEKLKSDFVTVTAHKLRTPLSKIKWALNSLGSIELSQIDKNALIKQSIESNEHLIALVNELLSVTLLEEGAFEYHFSAYPLDKLVNEIIKGFEILTIHKNIGIIFNKETGVLYNAEIDKDKLFVAIGNVIDNAIKYSEKNNTVRVNMSEEEEKIILSVTNIGTGIPKNEQKNIFTKFFRGAKATPLYTEGFGLGLYFSKVIINKHGGNINFESKEGGETTFYITLPLDKQLI